MSSTEYYIYTIYLYIYSHIHIHITTHTDTYIHTHTRIHICKTVCNLFRDFPHPDPASHDNQSVASQ